MKKILILSFILCFGIFTYAQDKVYSEPVMSAVALVDADGANWNGNNWTIQSYAQILGDSAQHDLYITDSICDPINTVRLSFDLYFDDVDDNTTFKVLVENRLSDNANYGNWDHASTEVADIDGIGTPFVVVPSDYAKGWHHFELIEGTHFTNPTDTLRFAFLVDSVQLLGVTQATGSRWAIDNISIDTLNSGTGLYNKVHSRNFEDGNLTVTNNWSVSSGTRSNVHWALKTVNGVEANTSTTDARDVSLTSVAMSLPDNPLNDVQLRFTSFSTDLGLSGNIYYIDATTNDTLNRATGNASPANAPDSDPVAGSIWNEDATYDLNMLKGRDVIISFEFNQGASVTDNFFLEHIIVEQMFDETNIPNEGNYIDLTVAPYSDLAPGVIYPSDTKYNMLTAEGFWQVEPEGWVAKTGLVKLDSTGTWPASIYYALFDTVGAGAAGLTTVTNVLESDNIAYSIPDIGAEVILNFDWFNTPANNSGDNKDPNFVGRAGVYSDFADIVVEIKVGTANWYTVWRDGDENMMSGIGTWDDYLTDGQKWYSAAIDISDRLTDGTSGNMKVRVTYVGDAENAGDFGFDNLFVTQDNNSEFAFSGTLPFTVDKVTGNSQMDYTTYPISQIDNPVNFGAIIYNYGVDTHGDGELWVDVNGDTFGYSLINDNGWDTDSRDSVYFKIDSILNVPAFENGQGLRVDTGETYTIDYTLTMDGHSIDKSTDQKVFSVTDTAYNKVNWADDLSTSTGTLDVDNGTYGSVGSVFEFRKEDVVENVDVALNAPYIAGTSESEVYLTIIKLASATATSGTKVFTSKRAVIENTGMAKYTFDVNMKMEASSFYAFMVNMTDTNMIQIGTNADVDGGIVRGDAAGLTFDNDADNIYMNIGIVPNEAPIILTEYAGDKIVVEAIADKDLATADSVAIKFVAADGNGDALTWDARVATPTWLADWIMPTTQVINDTLVLYGKPTVDDLGTTSLTVTVRDGKGGMDSYDFAIEVVSELAAFTPDFIPADFRQFTQDDDVNGAGNSSPWDRISGMADTSCVISGDVAEDQKEWLISPPVAIPSETAMPGATYEMAFNWKVGKFSAFCGGIFDNLGSGSATAGEGNFADVSLVISTNNGETWSDAKWREDDDALLAPLTEGIYQGAKWTYADNTDYTSVLSLDEYKGDTILVAFIYESKNVENAADNKFTLSNFSITANNPVDVDVVITTDLVDIPAQHADWTNGVNYNIQFINYGQKVTEGAEYSINFPIQGFYEEVAMGTDFFAAGDTVTRTFKFIPDSANALGTAYTLSVDVDITGNDVTTAADIAQSKTVTITDAKLMKDYNAAADGYAEYTLKDFDGLGTIYDLPVKDSLESVAVGFVAAGSDVSLSIVKIDTSGNTLIATINDNNGAVLTDGAGTITIENDNDFDNPLLLEAGKYAVLVHQVNNGGKVTINRTDRGEDAVGFVRGNVDMLYNEADDKGFLNMALNFVANAAPEFVAETVEDTVVYQKVAFSHIVKVKNPNIFGKIVMSAKSIPAWLDFVDNGDGTAKISTSSVTGEIGVDSVVIEATDGFNDITASIVIEVVANPLPEFLTTPPSAIVVGAPFEYVAAGFDVLGDDVFVTFQNADTAWLSIAGSGTDTLILTGTPTAAGKMVVHLQVADANGQIAHQTFELTIYDNKAPMFVSSPVTMGKVDLMYEYSIVTSDANGNEGLTISADLAVGSWLTLIDNGNGRAMLSGKVDTVGVDTVTLTVADASGATATQQVVINKVSNVPPVVTSAAVTEATEDINYEYEMTATDADGDYLTFVAVALPNWMTFTVTGNGVAKLQGVPLQSSEGDTDVSIKVSDGENSVMHDFVVNLTMVDDAPMFKTAEIATAQTGTSYEAMVEAWDEEGAKLSFSGDIPAWLTLTTEGDVAKLSGVPTNAGTYTLDLRVSDGNTTVDRTFELSVSGATAVIDDLAGTKMYPNPANAEVVIEGAEGANVSIYSTTGALVKLVKDATAKEVIDINDIESGAYIVRIVKDDKVSTKSLNIVK